RIRRTSGLLTAHAPRRCFGVEAAAASIIRLARSTSAARKRTMPVEAVMLWNEPNKLSHWDFELDPEWQTFSEMTRRAADAVRASNSNMTCVLGGIWPIDSLFIPRMLRQRVL